MINIVAVLLFSAVPATLGWWLARNANRPTRIMCAAIAGQIVVTPYFELIASREATPIDNDAQIAVAVVVVVALFCSLLAAAALELSKGAAAE